MKCKADRNWTVRSSFASLVRLRSPCSMELYKSAKLMIQRYRILSNLCSRPVLHTPDGSESPVAEPLANVVEIHLVEFMISAKSLSYVCRNAQS